MNRIGLRIPWRWIRWLPWRYLIRDLARTHNFIDPVALVAQLYNFSQPADIKQPIELLRAGVVMHARGLLNNQVIQHNLDWIWPYWIDRQFDPNDPAFLPRGFGLTNINLTHRNWTALGVPGSDSFPIVDPRGLLTPFWDGWSLDCIVRHDGKLFVPSNASLAEQKLLDDNGLTVQTKFENGKVYLTLSATVNLTNNQLLCLWDVEAKGVDELIILIRPYNPEGVSLIHRLDYDEVTSTFTINRKKAVQFSYAPIETLSSIYREGDVYRQLLHNKAKSPGVYPTECPAGMATAAAIFTANSKSECRVQTEIFLGSGHLKSNALSSADLQWQSALFGLTQLNAPDPLYNSLFRCATKTLILLSASDVFPGPYTYKRFWFRDATFILNALMCLGETKVTQKALDMFISRQRMDGYFHSQEGEWDSNGQVLWILNRFCELQNRAPKDSWLKPILKGVDWIDNFRIPEGDLPESGLMPAGFSAEHFGPSDYYYWDDFWSIAGLIAASDMLSRLQLDPGKPLKIANELLNATEKSWLHCTAYKEHGAIPSSPYRRMDAGAVGSLVAIHPLDLALKDEEPFIKTIYFLLEHCFVNNAFFHDVIHSGYNPYLTLNIAQILLRQEDPRFLELVDTIANLASPTGQWPEAIHPRTKGGCMGDGQHAWAAAEWVLMIKNMFIRESANSLVLLAGIPPRWVVSDNRIKFGPVLSKFGSISFDIRIIHRTIQLSLSCVWHKIHPPCRICLPGFRTHVVESLPEKFHIVLEPE